MVSYAAIEVNQATVVEMFAHVFDVPDGQSRLAWAMFRYPWVEGCKYFFIGGNYLGINQPDFTKQILRKSQLDAWFTYNEKSIARKNGPRQNGSWFIVTPREGIIFRGPRSKVQEELTA